MEQVPFSFMNIPFRSDKPRDSGITMMIDWGMGIQRQRDLLDIAAAYIDIAKIAVGLSGIIPERVLKEKIRVYADYRVEAFIGGQFLEYGIYHQGLEIAKPYFEEAKRLGYKYVEISDNNIEIPSEDKFELIRMGREEFGLRILGEVGTKTQITSPEEMVKGINGCLAAGAWKVFVEGAEFTDKRDGTLLSDVIEGVTKGVNINDVIFELPGRWISNVHGCGIHDMEVYLIDEFGPEVNIANVAPDEVMELETLRTGVGVKLK
ncbi:MAG: phosphosulfolactate synthase [Deltaproteobacteria bacterium]|nr:phosphosulfolactate synthase [Deltaproteobacteria bacterium]